MEQTKISKKALKSLLNDSLRDALGHLELPKPTKKVKKLLNKSSRKLASEFVQILKKENRRARKAEKSFANVDDVLKGKKNKKRRESKLQAVEAV